MKIVNTNYEFTSALAVRFANFNMDYKFTEIEEWAKNFWKEKNIYRVGDAESGKPKFYVLDMFPYPSGAGLHVGHPLGYIASDIYSRYKRMKGFNVLHPMGMDSFGLPAEQYAIQTGQHPAITTERNIATFKKQMDQLGFSFDWSREVRTSDPKFYKWTQWIFIQLFHSWYNNASNKAEKIDSLISEFEKSGNANVKAATAQEEIFSANDWKNFSAKQKSDVLLNYRLAYIADSWVNWCPALGTVLANDEVKDGVSERGGYPVERKLMKQWSLRITAYSERLLQGLNELDWSDSIKEAQRNWIGKSEGASVKFDVGTLNLEVSSTSNNKSKIQDQTSKISIEVFTTRPDTIFGVTFLTLAPEHELISQITTAEQKKAVEEYVAYAKNRSERERMTDVKKITGVFSGAYAVHPFSGKQIPIWIGEYVLAGYGTGAVMGVPGHDSRDYGFAKHFNLEIIEVVSGGDISKEAFEDEGTSINSDFLNGLKTADAKQKAIEEIEKKNIGTRKINYKQRDAIFGRQRYWGEPIPVYYDEEGIPKTVDENDLPVKLPEVDKYLPTETGEPPLARASNWKYKEKYNFELTTMPGWAGSSWYFLRYEDPNNENSFASKDAINYWRNIDFYIGGYEHATGHLLYFRFWTKFLFDLGYIPFDEPAQRLVNQGMIQGVSAKVFKNNFNFKTAPAAVPFKRRIAEFIPDEKLVDEIVDVYLCKDFVVNESNKLGLPDVYSDINLPADYADFTKHQYDIKEFYDSGDNRAKNILFMFKGGVFLNGKFYSEQNVNTCSFGFTAVPEKMSKSKYNVVNPEDIVSKYGADCFRLYEMFLGPIEMSKPWDTKGIDGVSRFLRKLWKLFYDENGNWLVRDEAATNEELKILHKTIKKVEDDMEKLSYNTSVSAFMICVNSLTDLKCNKKEVLKDLLLIMAPFAPFTTEYLWRELKQEGSVVAATFPKVREELLVENSFEYPVAVNGKTKTKISFPLDKEILEIEKEVVATEALQKYFEGKQPKKIIVVKGRMINVVI